jgi:YQGE family putative transporter
MFWVPYHIDFAKFSSKKNRGKQIGVAAMMASVISVLGPILGAGILVLFGFKVLFTMVSVLLLVSVIPLFFSKEVHQPTGFSLKGFFSGQKPKDVISFLGHGIENKMSTIVWPIFIFIFIFGEKYTTMGVLSSLILLIAMISTFFISKFSDISRHLVLKTGSVLNSVVWIARSFIVTPIQVFFTEVIYGISHPTMHIPFDAINYDKARKKKLLTKMILEREIYHNIGVLILFTILVITTKYMTELFRYGGPLSSLMRFFF